MNSRKTMALAQCITAVCVIAVSATATDFGTKSGALWAPYVEWSIDNVSWSGNAFDVVAEVAFSHQGSDHATTTEMFYSGGSSWKFRFAGTRIGVWDFTTSSSNGNLDGHTGSVEIAANDNADMRGFMLIQGHKFVRQSGEDDVEGFIPNIWMNYREEYAGPEGKKACGWTPIQYVMGNSGRWNSLLDQAWDHGCNGVQVLPQRDMMDPGGENNPHLENFQAMEEAIVAAHKRGMFVHLFMWGDTRRGWTPPDGINSDSDKRLNRYIAARLGPLPGWYASLGFDLMEWADESKVEAWAEHLQRKLGWYHPLGARKEGSFEASLPIYSTDDRISENWYSGTRRNFEAGGNKPVEYSRRFAYLRDNVWTMDATREAFWGFALAGGAGSIWGHYPDGCPAHKEGNYPNPEQLRTHRRFWQHRFLPELEPDGVHDGVITAKTNDESHWILYKESTSSMTVDLSGMNSSQPAIAVDCKADYAETDLGTLQPENRTITFDHSSDWAVAVGDFDSGPATRKHSRGAPNPAAGNGITPRVRCAGDFVRVSRLNPSKVYTLHVLDLSGRRVLATAVTACTTSATLPRPPSAGGVFLLRMRSGAAGAVTEKIVVR